MTEFPDLCAITILLLNVIKDLIIRQDFLILVIIDQAAELKTLRLLVKLGIIVLEGLNDAGMEALAIVLQFKQEGAANKVRGVECRELGQLGPIGISGK